MDILQESTYKLNNVDSFVHCLYQERPVTPTKNNKKFRYHYHEYIELLYFPEGEGVVWINGIKNSFSPGTFIIVNSQKTHFVQFYKEGKIICIKFLPQVLYENEQSFLYFKYVSPFISANEDKYVFSVAQIKHTSVVGLLYEIISEWERRDVAYELMIRGNILRIFVNLFRIWNNTKDFFDSVNLSPEISKSLFYITANYQTANEKEVSNLCGLSSNYFSTLFKKQMNISFRDYLINVKIAESEKLLLTTSKSVTEIASDVGFATTSYYISLFHKKKGITPAQFRKAALK